MAIPLLLAAATFGTGAMQALGTYSQAGSQADALRKNARLLDQNAVLTEKQAALAEQLQRKRSGQILGAQRASIAQSGFAPVGTMAQIAEESGTAAELDALNIRYEGALKAKSMRDEAAQMRTSARAVKQAGALGAFGQLIQSGVSAYGGYAAAGGGTKLGAQ